MMQEQVNKADVQPMANWARVRKLVVLQIKLYIDAFRDICLSPLALIAFVVDLVQRNPDADSYLEWVMQLGRQSEKAINLFNQHDPATQSAGSVDALLRDVEERLRR